jgi:hypothetical protein
VILAGREVRVPPGASTLETAPAAGTAIPTRGTGMASVRLPPGIRALEVLPS